MKKILIADDLEIFRTALKAYLKSDNYTIIEAENGIQAMETIKKHKIDLIFCDVNMPEANGNEVYHFIKNNAEYSQIPFVFLTAFLDNVYVNKNEVECISKPVTKVQVKAIAEKYLGT